ncbi:MULTISPECIES: hypothetical protein [unclassified Cupriavidus]|uniref:hypothetical protein n=1 Tax=unclassified Cupriavidus TaxID=2640874 RepID=UPI00295E7E93|nr:hypothetical protein [Cupriavidus sp. TA19]
MVGSLWRWVKLGFALVALTLLTLACHAMWPDKDGMAAWFQAIGSVIAIFIAVWVPARQRQFERETQHLEQLEAAVVLAHRMNVLANDFVFLLLAMGAKRTGHWIFELDVSAVSDLLARLRHYERDESDHVRAGLAFDLRRLVRELQSCFPMKAGTPQPFEDNTRTIDDLLERGDGLINETKIFCARAEALLKSAQDKRGRVTHG